MVNVTRRGFLAGLASLATLPAVAPIMSALEAIPEGETVTITWWQKVDDGEWEHRYVCVEDSIEDAMLSYTPNAIVIRHTNGEKGVYDIPIEGTNKMVALLTLAKGKFTDEQVRMKAEAESKLFFNGIPSTEVSGVFVTRHQDKTIVGDFHG